MSRQDRDASSTVPVTVVIPAHNREARIGRAVRSALAQQPWAPAEVIVVDDCSSDDTAQVAQAAGARVIRHDTNRGAGAARNTGIASATQPWIALLDSDDEWLTNHLATLWPQRDGHVLLSGAALSRGPGHEYAYVGTAARRGEVVRSPLAIAALSFFAASGVLVRREVVLATGGFRTLYVVEDLDLWLRVLERGTAYASPVVTVVYNVHEGQVSGDAARMEAGHRAVLESYRTRPWFRASVVRRWDAIVAWDGVRTAVRVGDRSGAARRIGAMLASPSLCLELAAVLIAARRRRRRTWRYAPTGAATLAVVADDPPAPFDSSGPAYGFEVVRPPGSSRRTRWLRLCLRPTTAVLADDAFDRAAGRLLGIRAYRRPGG